MLSGTSPHVLELAIVKQHLHHISAVFRAESIRSENPGRSRTCEPFRVEELVSVTVTGIGNQYGRHSDGGKLRKGSSAGARQYEIGRSHHLRKIRLERRNMRAPSRIPVRPFDGVPILGSRQMHTMHSVTILFDGSERVDDESIDRVRALASPHDQQDASAWIEAVSEKSLTTIARGARRTPLGRLRHQVTQGITRHARTDKPRNKTGLTLLFRTRDTPGQRAKPPVDLARHNILFHENNRYARELCGKDSGQRGITAEPHGHIDGSVVVSAREYVASNIRRATKHLAGKPQRAQRTSRRCAEIHGGNRLHETHATEDSVLDGAACAEKMKMTIWMEPFDALGKRQTRIEVTTTPTAEKSDGTQLGSGLAGGSGVLLSFDGLDHGRVHE